MKNIVSVLAILFVVSLSFTACRKYEEGPNVSLRTKKARITNNWRVESAAVNGADVSADPLWAKQKHYMFRDGKYIITIINPVTLEARNMQGNWVLSDDNSKLELTSKNYTGNIDSTNIFNILKLRNKELWIRKEDNTVELHFVPFDER